MNLATKKLEGEILDEIDSTEKWVSGDNTSMKFTVDFGSFGESLNPSVTKGVKNVLSKFGNKLTSSSDDMTKDAIRSTFNAVKIVHSTDAGDKPYKLGISDKTCTLTADFLKNDFNDDSKLGEFGNDLEAIL
jgi:hypothetical protein